MNELVEMKNETFVEPYYIEELGCDGLTSEDIAKSLGAHVDTVRRKLRERPDESLESLGCMTCRMKNINGVEFDEFFLSATAAKFFVARYDNELGRAYLRYLLGLESAVNALKEKMRAAGLSFSQLVSTLDASETMKLENQALKDERASLEEKVRLSEEEANKQITQEEWGMLGDIIRKNAKRYPDLVRQYERDTSEELIVKFCPPSREDLGYYDMIRRKDWLAALDFVQKHYWPFERQERARRERRRKKKVY